MTGAGRARRRDGEALHAPISQNRRSTIWTLRSSASARTGSTALLKDRLTGIVGMPVTRCKALVRGLPERT